MHAIVKVEDLDKTYADGFQALNNANLEVFPGEIFGLLGPNGAGKTTPNSHMVTWQLSRPLRKATILLALLAASNGIAAETAAWPSITIVGQEIAPGQTNRFPFIQDRSFQASYLNTMVFVTRGSSPGPTLCLSAGIHGDELNGVEVARRIFAQTDPATLKGTLIGLPVINAEGIRTGNRNMSDRRDLNRSFPGTSGGSAASLVANEVFTLIVQHCDALIDLHTASNNRANVPQIRADVAVPAIRELAVRFGVGIVIGGEGPDKSLRREAAKAGITAIIYEAGEPLRFQEDEIAHGVTGVLNAMTYLEMIPSTGAKAPQSRILAKSKWVRANPGQGGFFFPTAKLGAVVIVGDTLGKIVDPFTDVEYVITSTIAGEIIGMAVPQPVLSGYGLFHIAWND
jgi:predicted deacylase